MAFFNIYSYLFFLPPGLLVCISAALHYSLPLPPPGNPEVRQLVEGVVSEHLQTLFEWQPALFNALCNKALTAQAASVAAKAAREMVHF